MAQENFSEDEILGKAYDAKLMKRLLGFIEPYKKYVIFAIVLNVFVAILSGIVRGLEHPNPLPLPTYGNTSRTNNSELDFGITT